MATPRFTVAQVLRLTLVATCLLQAVLYLVLLLAAAPSTGKGFDFQVFYEAGAKFNRGEDLYLETDASDGSVGPVKAEAYVYVYPPLFAALMSPLARLPFETALAWWTHFNYLAVAVAVFLLIRMTDARNRDLKLVTLLLWLMCSFPLLATFTYGQTNALILLLFALTLWLVEKRTAAAAAVLGLAAAIKIMPVLPLAFLWRQRGRESLAPSVLVLVVSLVVLPRQAQSYMTNRLPFVLQRDTLHPLNQSLPALIKRFFVGNPHTEAWVDAPAVGRALALLAALSLLALTARSVWSRAKSPEELRLGFSLVLLATLLAPGIVEFHYFIFCAIPAMFMLDAAATLHSPRARLTMTMLIACAMSLLLFPSFLFTDVLKSATVLGWLRSPAGPLAVSYSTFGILLLFGLNLLLLDRTRAAQAQASGAP